ncbi:MAG: glycoside hydrolase family 140 protein [Thaumarchaeota archaeon]|nr:glycoside hydrolase family 140 protein [Nitrososphaerota archaeon]
MKYPLKISKNRRYLVDQKGVPFLLQGDAPWSLIVGIPKEDAVLYLENRKQKRFNTLLVNLIEHKFCKNPPNNFYNEPPFLKPGDFSSPNEAYFEHADRIIGMAAEKNIQILLCPLFLGQPGTDEGWYEELIRQSSSQCLEYGSYLGKRYSQFDNIIWSLGCDRNPQLSELERMNLIALGIKEHDKRHLMTAQCLPEFSSVDIYSGGGWLDINATYTYSIPHRKILFDYNKSPVMPVFLIESTYEGEHNSSHVQIRRQAYWSILSGGFGHVFGNYAIWPFGQQFGNKTMWPPAPGIWQEELNKLGSMSMYHWGNLFRSRPWYDLIPDQKHEVITGGLGEFRGLEFTGAARTADGSCTIAYTPTARPIEADLSKMGPNRVNVWWYDPATGKSIHVGEYSATGKREFSPPENGDWVLILDDASKSFSVPGIN